MPECDMTLTGKHSYAPRRWLGYQGRDYAGNALQPWVTSNYHTELACICGKRPQPAEITEIRERLTETKKVRSLVWGKEPAEQGKLEL